MRPDQDLVRAMLAGEPGAFDELYARHAPALRQRLARMVRDPAAAEDLLQETFLKLWTRAEQWRGGEGLDPWLTSVATNLALNHLRSQRRRPGQPLEAAAVAGQDESELSSGRQLEAASLAPDELCEQAEQRQLLHALVQTLPNAQREVLLLMLEQQLNTAEIAAALEVAEGTVKSRLHYARERLKAHTEHRERKARDD